MTVNVLGETQYVNCWEDLVAYIYTGILFLLFLPVGFYLLSYNSKHNNIFTVVIKVFFPIYFLSSCYGKQKVVWLFEAAQQ